MPALKLPEASLATSFDAVFVVLASAVIVTFELPLNEPPVRYEPIVSVPEVELGIVAVPPSDTETPFRVNELLASFAFAMLPASIVFVTVPVSVVLTRIALFVMSVIAWVCAGRSAACSKAPAVTLPFESTVSLVYVPAVTPVFASVSTPETSLVPSNDTLHAASPVAAMVRGVGRLVVVMFVRPLPSPKKRIAVMFADELTSRFSRIGSGIYVYSDLVPRLSERIVSYLSAR